MPHRVRDTISIQLRLHAALDARARHQRVVPAADIGEIRKRHLVALMPPRPAEDRKIILTLNAAARDWLAEKGWDPAYGARPLKRVIQRYVQDPLAEMILSGEIKEADRVAISEKGNVLTFNGKAPKTAEIAQFEAPVPKRKMH